LGFVATEPGAAAPRERREEWREGEEKVRKLRLNFRSIERGKKEGGSEGDVPQSHPHFDV